MSLPNQLVNCLAHVDSRVAMSNNYEHHHDHGGDDDGCVVQALKSEEVEENKYDPLEPTPIGDWQAAVRVTNNIKLPVCNELLNELFDESFCQRLKMDHHEEEDQQSPHGYHGMIDFQLNNSNTPSKTEHQEQEVVFHEATSLPGTNVAAITTTGNDTGTAMMVTSTATTMTPTTGTIFTHHSVQEVGSGTSISTTAIDYAMINQNWNMLPVETSSLISSPNYLNTANLEAAAHLSNEEIEESPFSKHNMTNKKVSHKEQRWKYRFMQLCEFQARNGHCLVPYQYEENPALGEWVKRQRYQLKLRKESKPNILNDERIELLNGIGFVWDSHGSTWNQRFVELCNFIRINNHCNVPCDYPQNPQLSNWVRRQRRQQRLFLEGASMNPRDLERIQKLQQIGFE